MKSLDACAAGFLCLGLFQPIPAPLDSLAHPRMVLAYLNDSIALLKWFFSLPLQDPLLRIFLFTVPLFLFRYLSAAKVRYFHSKTRLDGKVAIVTGASRGIGRATAKELARRGCSVILACRDVEAAEAAKAEIEAGTTSGGGSVQVLPLDVSSFISIKTFAAKFGSTHAQLDLLIHNAGRLSFFGCGGDGAGCHHNSTQVSSDGMDLTMATNYYGPFLLTRLLLDKMKAAPSARIVYVTSGFYKYAALDTFFSGGSGDRGGLLGGGGGAALYALPIYKYFLSKCAAVAFSQEFTDRLRESKGGNSSSGNITFNCVNPGSVNTDLFRNVPPVVAKLYAKVRGWYFKTPLEGVQTILYAAISEELDNVSGKYFVDNREEKLEACVMDAGLRRQLWEHSMQVVNL